MAVDVIKQRLDHPGLRRYIPDRPGVPRDMVAAANVADMGVAGLGGTGHVRTIAPLPP